MDVIPELRKPHQRSWVFARSIMKAQVANLPFTPVFAALVSVINTKLPTIGEFVASPVDQAVQKGI